MRKLVALAFMAGLSAIGAHGAVVTYSLGGSSEFGSQISGSFSFDSAVIGPNYSSFTALDDLLSFNMTLSSIPGTPATTTFTKSDLSSLFVVQADGTGALIDFNPGFVGNGDGYSLSPWNPNQANLFLLGEVFPTDTVLFTYAQVPELGSTALAVGLGLLGFVGARSWRRRG